MTGRRTRIAHWQRGYTVVELLMSLSVLAIGVSGVLAMQRVTVAANREARQLTVATRIAEAWADQLTADAVLWRGSGGTSTIALTTWLNVMDPTNTNPPWLVPVYSVPRNFGPGFSPLGAPLEVPNSRPDLIHYCTHLRLSLIHDDALPTAGNGAIRAQIRVFWRKDDAALDSPEQGDLCSVDESMLDASEDAFHVIYLTTAVRQAARGRT